MYMKYFYPKVCLYLLAIGLFLFTFGTFGVISTKEEFINVYNRCLEQGYPNKFCMNVPNERDDKLSYDMVEDKYKPFQHIMHH